MDGFTHPLLFAGRSEGTIVRYWYLFMSIVSVGGVTAGGMTHNWWGMSAMLLCAFLFSACYVVEVLGDDYRF